MALLPGVTSSDATVRSLWQVDRLSEQVVIDDAVVGVVQTGEQSRLHAVSAATGKPLWTFTFPVAEPQTSGVLAAQGVVIAEVGHEVVGGGPGGPIVTQLVVIDARSGARLWTEHVGGRTQAPPVAIASGVVVLGDPVGTLIARNVRSGERVWQRSRPAMCPRAGPAQYDEALVADGPVLAVSYQCSFRTTSRSLVERLDLSSGTPAWEWTTVTLSGGFGGWLSVVGAASSGETVFASGQFPPKVPSLAGTLGRAMTWPSNLGSPGQGTLVSLDAATGRPRWNEFGSERYSFVQITFVDGAVCESMALGFQCRDDVTGEPTRPVFHSGYGPSAIPPYESDAFAGISGDTTAAVVSTSATHSVSLIVMPVRGTSPVAHVNVDVGTTTVDGSRYDPFVVGTGQLANGATLLLLRRIDVSTYPLLALSVASDARTAKK
ncbi:MAG: PQQ-binding-like beta-propeller repeat protein [Acidimicrobiia bacterium]